jgi:hypothetical protein
VAVEAGAEVTRLVPAGLMLGVAVVVALGFTGKMPHEWFGISTSTLLGWGIVGAFPTLLVVMLYVIIDRQNQLRRGQAQMSRQLEDLTPPRRRGRVVQGPWEGSG